jgi:transcriptional regulator with AAA-type ATPase domain
MRKFERFDVSVPLSFQTKNQERFQGVAKNVSITGCFVESSSLPDIHSFIKLDIELPSFGTIEVCGIVLRVGGMGFSIHFNWVDKESLRKLGWFLFHLYPGNSALKELVSKEGEVSGLMPDSEEVVLGKGEADPLEDSVVEQLLRKSWASLIERSPNNFFDMMLAWSSHLFSPNADSILVADLSRPIYLGSSPAMKEILKKIRRFSPTTLPVLLIGETGVGKEMFARMIHDMSQFREGPFVPVNCGAIPDSLFESLVFGHEKGTFTGAYAQQHGWLESSRGGTLFLDEIGEIPLSMQVKLLRVLQEKTFNRIGSAKEIPFESRVIAATNKNLKEEVRLGNFREDLFYRIEGLLIEIPPLRSRLEDVLPLAEYLLCVINRELKMGKKFFSKQARQNLLDHPWQGNVRELQNAIYRAVIVSESQEIKSEDLGLAHIEKEHGSFTFKELMAQHEKEILRKCLLRHDGNVTKVSEELKISRPSVYNMIKKFNIR